MEGRGQYIGSEVFTAVTMKNAVFWNVALCVSYKNRRFVGKCRLYPEDGDTFRRTSVLIRPIRRHIPGSGQLHATVTLTPEEVTLILRFIGGLVDCKVGLDSVKTREICFPC
jgi:hypothetical protein